MAKNKLIALSLIYHQPMHPYAMTAVIKETGLEHWAHISPASIYNALSRLEKRGSVDVSVEVSEHAPDRKVYHITDQGKRELKAEQEAAILSPSLNDFPFHLAGLFLFGLTATEARSLFTRRIDLLEKAMARMQNEQEQLETVGLTHVTYSIRAARDHLAAEIAATRRYDDLITGDPHYFSRYGTNFYSNILNKPSAIVHEEIQ